MRIDDIIVGERHRSDMGDIDGLARSINEVGLLHPVVVRPDGLLIAGRRRILACQKLGWTEIPVTILRNGEAMPSDGNYELADIGPTCVVCGYPFAHIHHALPREYGGSDDDSNLVSLCPNHHAAVHFLLQIDIWLASDEGRQRLDARPKDKVSAILARQAYLAHCDRPLSAYYQEHIVPMIAEQSSNENRT